MYQQDVIITSPNGIHTRPAGRLVQEAMTFQADITVTSSGKNANAKKLFSLQTLNLSHGCTLTISAQGVDEKEAVNHLVALIKNL
ncbi:phosphocarrier protein Hpr [Orbus sasakiae]|uniref:Phosphocarrier protein HPr n=1 Tax=Orbus sasakiae TaxID=1078475 RepID=A0ABP9N9M6_9GAMM